MVKKFRFSSTVSNRLMSAFLMCLMAVAGFYLNACAPAQKKIVMPQVTQTPSQERHTGKIIWYDLFTHDLAKSSAFYHAVFGWTFSETAPGIPSVKTVLKDGVPIGNAFHIDPLKPGFNESRWITYISAEDVDKTAILAKENGGRIYMPPKSIPNRGRVAAIIDPQGAIFGVLNTSAGDPPDSPATSDRWIGSELWTTDLDKAIEFYHKLVGYERREAVIGERSPYNLLYAGEHPRAGIVKIPWEEVEPDWIPYVAVDDVMAATEKIKKAGGNVLIPPHQEVREGLLAIIADPAGAVFAIQQIDAISTSDEGETDQ